MEVSNSTDTSTYYKVSAHWEPGAGKGSDLAPMGWPRRVPEHQPFDPVVASFAESLASGLHDGKRFREYLKGKHLPALGGDLDPAEILRRAVGQVSDPHLFARSLADALARVIAEEARQTPDTWSRDVLLNALYLAAELPSSQALTKALQQLLARWKPLRETGRHEEEENALWLALWRALVYQQEGSSLETEWMAVLGDREAPWTPARRSLLMEAWRGLLWIPPDADRSVAGEVIDFDRVERGLLTLSRTLDGRERGREMLRYAFEVLCETFPRSQEFWTARFRQRVLKWPAPLKDEATRRWPDLEKPSSKEWQTLPPHGRDEFAPEPAGSWTVHFSHEGTVVGRVRVMDPRASVELVEVKPGVFAVRQLKRTA